jgi:hypothetical protein
MIIDIRPENNVKTFGSNTYGAKLISKVNRPFKDVAMRIGINGVLTVGQRSGLPRQKRFG